ncbi:hypothetical protein ACFPPD_03275 [Cohnella suwonensis]|uniref:Uncharacterized protein n=1 Tax=Cohnella suwonensis TaxID=696072 RepID=A0ABW0LR17_9BACL
MNKIRILPIAITAALTAAVLFGGWFGYRHYGVEQPLDRVANAIAGVENATVEMGAGSVKIDVKLAPDANIAEVYRKIKQEGSGEIGSKQFELTADASSNERLEKAWSYALFDVAEAMETRKYSGIRDAMDGLSAHFPGVTATTDMDEDNVYISLRDGNAAKFVVLPREPATLGAWSNA